ncbi:MAG: hypothetical protein EAZ11_10380 [Curvibacter sp.]|nr:MAG: hypothetical protein EAZ11_10380 [Curvibacter sp.]
MELAIGVGFNGSNFFCRTVTSAGELNLLPLKTLHNRGLPTGTKTTRCRVESNFSDWRKVSASEYLSTFGFQLPDSISDEHQFYETEIDGRRFVIPALALMRALFRPALHMLPAMFRPQALDQIGRITPSESGLKVEIDASWAKAASSGQSYGWKSAISWFFAHPSASLSAGSVHTNARSGRIDLSLPDAEARIVFTGVRVAKTIFVVDASVMTVTPLDAPIDDLVGLPKTFLLHQSALGKPKITTEITVPFHSDGSSALSDLEWEKVENVILTSRQKASNYKLSQRDLLDGVLEKLATNQSWKEINYKVGTWVNASAMFHRLGKRGALPEILEVLVESRTGST